MVDITPSNPDSQLPKPSGADPTNLELNLNSYELLAEVLFDDPTIGKSILARSIEDVLGNEDPLSEEQKVQLLELIDELIEELKLVPEEELADSMELGVRQLIADLREEIDFTAAQQKTKQEASGVFGWLRAGADWAKEKVQILSSAYQTIQEKGLITTVRETAGDFLSYLNDRKMLLLPALMPVAAAMSGGDVGLAALSALKLTGGLLVIDKTIDLFLESSSKVLPSFLLTLSAAAMTNFPELGQSLISALSGDGTLVAPSGPLGSNPANLLLLGAAVSIIALGGRAKDAAVSAKNGFLERLSNVDWGALSKQVGFATLMAGSAIAFKLGVQEAGPEMYGWFAANAGLVAAYMYRNTFSQGARLRSLMSEMSDADLQRAMDSAQNLPEDTRETLTSIFRQAAVGNVDGTLDDTLSGHTFDEKSVLKMVKDLRKELKGEQLNAIREMVSQSPDDYREMAKFLSTFGIKVSSEPVDKKAVIDMVVACGVLIGSSVVLDSGVGNLAEAFTIGKDSAGFYIFSLFSSAPEFVLTLKLLNQYKEREAAKNMADSSAINIGLAGQAALVSGLRSSML